MIAYWKVSGADSPGCERPIVMFALRYESKYYYNHGSVRTTESQWGASVSRKGRRLIGRKEFLPNPFDQLPLPANDILVELWEILPIQVKLAEVLRLKKPLPERAHSREGTRVPPFLVADMVHVFQNFINDFVWDGRHGGSLGMQFECARSMLVLSCRCFRCVDFVGSLFAVSNGRGRRSSNNSLFARFRLAPSTTPVTIADLDVALKSTTQAPY